MKEARFNVEGREFYDFAEARNYAQAQANALLRTVWMVMYDECGAPTWRCSFNHTPPDILPF